MSEQHDPRPVGDPEVPTAPADPPPSPADNARADDSSQRDEEADR
jgi:hypothetical protein